MDDREEKPKNVILDKEEGCVYVKISSEVYSSGVVNSAAYVFLDKAYIIIDKKEDYFVVCLYPKDNTKEDEKLNSLGLEFYDELVSYKHYFDRQKDSNEIAKMIIERAVFSAAPTLLEEAEEQEINELLNDLEQDDDEEIKEIVKEIRDEESNKNKETKNEKDKA